MTYSIIILNYKVKYFTDACLQSVIKAVAGKDAEIIVTDNNSTDGSKIYLKDKYTDVKFLWFDKNYGFGKAYNKAVKHAKGKYLLFLNPDTLVSEDILEQFKNFADKNPGFGIIGGKMIDGTGNFLPESKRGIPTPIVAFSKLTKLYKIFNFNPFNRYYALHLKEDETGEVSVLTGALMFLSKETFETVGGFDEQYFMYGEDIDLSYTILKSGKKNYYLPTAKIIHFKGESSRQNASYFQNFLNTTFQFYRKHFRSFPPLEFLMRLFFKMWLYLRIKRTQTGTKNINFKAFYFVGSETNFNKLKSKFSDLKHIKSHENIQQKPAMLIFDTSNIPFSEIIDKMIKLKNTGLYFRFYFPERKMLIGSDTKDNLGKVQFNPNHAIELSDES